MSKEIPAGAVHIIEVDGDDGKVYTAYLKKPGRDVLERCYGLFMNFTKDPQYISAGEVVIRSCWVGGDAKIKDDEDLLVSASIAAFELINVKAARLKKI